MKEPISSFSDSEPMLAPTYASRYLNGKTPKYRLADGEMPPEAAYRLIKDELALDGNAHMNLATFVTTWMEPEATLLMAETLDKNMIDKDEYPQTAELEYRCVKIVSKLWNAPDPKRSVGTSTVGSSEACMLAGMAFKWRHKAKNPKVTKPNLVMGINVQVCWEKFCRYWEIEPRFVPMEPGQYHLDPQKAAKLCDANTIGVVAIMGSTFDGSYEPVEALAKELDKVQKAKGWDIPIHVDAASGGFVAPFLQPSLKWDFRLERVKSINASAHKYGLVYPGLGWAVWRDIDDLPRDLVFDVNYLGGSMPTFTLNFSKPGNNVIVQYYNFLRLGRDGYTRIQKTCQNTAMYLAAEIAKMGDFELLTEGKDLPVLAFKLKDSIQNFSVFDLSDRLRMNGWQVPAYTLPKNLEKVAVMRVVVKENFSEDLAKSLLKDIERALEFYKQHPEREAGEAKPMFHH